MLTRVIHRFPHAYPLAYFPALWQYIDMVCIYCGHDTKVINSRHQKRANNIWRRRKCLNCGAITTTIEKNDLSGALSVRRQNSIRPFSRDVLFLSVHDSLRHRKAATDDAGALYDTILSQLAPHIDQGVIDRDVIVTITTEILDRFDKAAATSYAAFHKL